MFNFLFEPNNKQLEFLASGLRTLGAGIFLTALARQKSALLLPVIVWFVLEMFAMWFLSHLTNGIDDE